MFMTPWIAYFDSYYTKNFTNSSLNNVLVISENRQVNILIKITLKALFAWHISNISYISLTGMFYAIWQWEHILDKVLLGIYEML